jgi:hypothetical protein
MPSRTTGAGRGYGTRTLVGACLVKSLFNLATWTWVAALIAEHPGLQDALGGAPSVWACYRFTTKLRANRPALAACIDAFAAALRVEHPDFGKDVAIDASDLPAYANGQRYWVVRRRACEARSSHRRVTEPPSTAGDCAT